MLACCLTRQANDDKMRQAGGWARSRAEAIVLGTWQKGEGGVIPRRGPKLNGKGKTNNWYECDCATKNASRDADAVLLRDTAAGRPLVPGVDIQGGRSGLVVEGEESAGHAGRPTRAAILGPVLSYISDSPPPQRDTHLHSSPPALV